ncbi:MAG: hypothetical protein ABSF33_21095, partial [Acidimicrobiales bacterium]
MPVQAAVRHACTDRFGQMAGDILVAECPSSGYHGPMGAGRTTSVTILGGCGHVGLPLGLALADSGLTVTLHDTNLAAVDSVRSGKMPHLEPGAPEVLQRTLADGRLSVSADVSSVGRCEFLVVVIGTPIDEHLNPDPQAVVEVLEDVADELNDG